MHARPQRERKKRVRLGEEINDGESSGVREGRQTSAIEHKDEEHKLSENQHSPSPPPPSNSQHNFDILAQLSATQSHQHQQQRKRREAQLNWCVAEDHELLELANQFGRNWKMVVKRSALLTRNNRTGNACRTRYNALKKQYADRQKRDASTAAQLDPRPSDSPEVQPQSADPGESMNDVEGIYRYLSPVHRTQHLERLLQVRPMEITPPSLNPLSQTSTIPAAAAASSSIDIQRGQREQLVDDHFNLHDETMEREIRAQSMSSAPSPTDPPAAIESASKKLKTNHSLLEISKVYSGLLEEVKQQHEEVMTVQRAALNELKKSTDMIAQLVQLSESINKSKR